MARNKLQERQAKFKRYEELVRKETELLHKMKEYRDGNLLEFFDKKPNPGPNPRQAELIEAWLDPFYKVFTFTGGNRLGKCVTYQTLIDTPEGKVSVGELYERGKSFDVYAWDGQQKVITRAKAPFKKPELHSCYRLEMHDGAILELADHHHVLTSQGWIYVEQLAASFGNLHGTILEPFQLIHHEDGVHCFCKGSDFLDHYFVGHGPNGEQPLLDANSGQVFVPLQDDVQQLCFFSCDMGAQDNRSSSTLCIDSGHLSSLDDPDRNGALCVESLFRSADKTWSSSLPVCQLFETLGYGLAVELQSDPLIDQHRLPFLRSLEAPYSLIGENVLKCITPIPACQEVYDFEVPKYHNYFAGGLIHHNTTIGTVLALSMMFGKFLWNNKSLLHLFNHNKPRKVRLVGQDWEKSVKTVTIPELEKWWPKSRLVKKKKNNVGVDAFWVDEKTGSTLEIMSNGQESDLFEGWSGDLVVYDEPPKRDIRVANARGLVDRLGRELFVMTLLKEAWVDREVIKATTEDGKPNPRVYNVHGQSYDNVGYGITNEGLAIFASTLTEDEKKARLKGVPSYMSGLVYPTFQRKTHLMDRFDVPLDWMVDIAIDVHPREKQAILFIATDPRNDRYGINEIWNHGDAKWIAESILKTVKYHSYRVHRILIDPLAKGDSNNKESVYQTVAKILLSRGYQLEVATKDKDQGILEVKKHLMGPNKKPSLFFFNDLVRTIFEIEGYMWDKETQKPVDKDDHMMENLYRLLLLNTKWTEMEDDYEADVAGAYDDRDAMTGY